MTRTERLEAALRSMLEVCSCKNGCVPADMTCATNVARAALADTAPSCCEETRREQEEVSLGAFAIFLGVECASVKEMLAAHDAEVRRAALEFCGCSKCMEALRART